MRLSLRTLQPLQALNTLIHTGLLFATALVLVAVVAPKVYAVRLKAETVTLTGLSVPVFGSAPAGQSGFLYIAEEFNMAIKVLNLQTKAVTTFLDMPGPNATGQGGLHTFAFHPDYANNGKFYMNIFDSQDGFVKVYEGTRSTTNPMEADLSSVRPIFSFENASHSHNGGWLDFSPTDGYLYIATGDGGAIGPPNYGLPAQNVNDLKGKILRIDVNGDDFPEDTTRDYAIPDGNPFADGGGAPEVFAWGLRHPYRNAFDPITGDLYIADVGSQYYEEINFLPAGTNGEQNYGWRAREGPFDNPNNSDAAIPGAIDPIHYYSRGSGAAIIAGYVYNGSAIPELQGQLVFGDFVKDKYWSLAYDGEDVTEFVDRSVQLANPAFATYSNAPLFGKDADGEIYIFDITRGDVFKIIPDPNPADYNKDGIVSIADYSVWRDTLGSTTLLAADGNGNGQIDAGDYGVWASRLAPSGGGGGSLVPEPRTISLGMFALAALHFLTQSRKKRFCASQAWNN